MIHDQFFFQEEMSVNTPSPVEISAEIHLGGKT